MRRVKTMQAQRIDSLTSLRFIAAALVVIFHSKGMFGGFSFAPHFSLTQAVSMFYVLSGFILAHTHKNISSSKELGMFYISRISRIWPLHLACSLAVIAIIHHYSGQISATTTALNFSLLQAWIPDQTIYFSLNGVAWSLSDEVFFYALFPLLILNIKKTWQIKLAASFTLTALMLFAFRDSERNLMLWSAYISPLTRLSEFMLGIAAYQIHLRIKHIEIKPHFAATVIEALAIALAGAAMWVGDLTFFSSLPLAINKSVSIWFANCGGAIAFAFLILTFSLERGLISKALRIRPLVYLGEISFALYMVHQIVLRLMDMYPQLTSGLPFAAAISLYYASSIICAAAAHHLIETPSRKLIVNTTRNVIYKEKSIKYETGVTKEN